MLSFLTSSFSLSLTSTKLPIWSLFLLPHLIYLFFCLVPPQLPNPEFHHFCHQLHHQLLKWFSWLGAVSPKICSIRGCKMTALEKYCHHFIHMRNKYLRISLISRLCLFGSLALFCLSKLILPAVSEGSRVEKLLHSPCKVIIKYVALGRTLSL